MTSFRPSFEGLFATSRIALAIVMLGAAAACTPYSGDQSSNGTGSAGGSSMEQGSGGTSGTSGSASSGSNAGTSDQTNTGSSGTVPAACVQRAIDLKDMLDTVTDFDAVLAISTPECGKQVIVSSDNAKITPASLHRIGSITKTFVSVVILSLVKEGRLGLNDAIDKFSVLPQSANVGTAITVRQLLNHTSGLYNYTDDSDFTASKTYKPADLVALALTNSSYSLPGAAFHYSNTNYILLGMIAEKVTGQTLGQLVRERALVPAGLNATFFPGEESVQGTLAPGMSSTGSDVTNAESPTSSWAAGAMVATPGDVLDWIDALYTGKILDANGVSALLDSGGTSMGGATGVTYGLGVMEYPADIAGSAGPSLGHDGSIRGYKSQASYFPQKQMGIVLIGDATDADVNTAFVSVLTALAN